MKYFILAVLLLALGCSDDKPTDTGITRELFLSSDFLDGCLPCDDVNVEIKADQLCIDLGYDYAESYRCSERCPRTGAIIFSVEYVTCYKK